MQIFATLARTPENINREPFRVKVQPRVTVLRPAKLTGIDEKYNYYSLKSWREADFNDLYRQKLMRDL